MKVQATATRTSKARCPRSRMLFRQNLKLPSLLQHHPLIPTVLRCRSALPKGKREKIKKPPSPPEGGRERQRTAVGVRGRLPQRNPQAEYSRHLSPAKSPHRKASISPR